ncbi:Ubiquitin carboxyl-terminal hydrolase 36 [Lobulomyces angularis]|nr:Ubiquitin carboxyl-terminal hydrolase 36 [Lobulomyces angularis]
MVGLSLESFEQKAINPLLNRRIEFKESKSHQTTQLKLRQKYEIINPGVLNLKSKEVNSYSNKKNKIGRESSKKHIEEVIDGYSPPNTVLFAKENLVCDWNFIKSVGPGLQNLGNTCFLNSVLQSLIYTPPLSIHLINETHSTTCRTRANCLLCDFESLVKKCLGNHSSTKHLSPVIIVRKLKLIAKHMRIGRQEDSHEFLRYFIDALVKPLLIGYESLDPASKETTFLHQIFAGHLRSQVDCSTCGYESKTFDPLLDLSLEIRNCNSLHKAFSHFTKPEILSKKNKYKCDKCKKLTEAKKQILIARAPSVLTIQLKRFDFTYSNKGDKINKHVDYEEVLNITPYTINPTGPPKIYKLYSVLVHSGGSMHSGHYYSFVKNSNGIWYRMDDESVSQVSLQQVLNQKGAYMLFYSQQQPRMDPKPTFNQAARKDMKKISTLKSAPTMDITIPINQAVSKIPEFLLNSASKKENHKTASLIKKIELSSEEKKTIQDTSLVQILTKKLVTPSLLLSPDQDVNNRKIGANNKKQEPSPPPETEINEPIRALTKNRSWEVRDIIQPTSNSPASKNIFSKSNNKWEESDIYNEGVAQWDESDISSILKSRTKLSAELKSKNKRRRPDFFDAEYDAGKKKKIRKKSNFQNWSNH